MIDKIIEELEEVAKENLGYENSSMTESEMRTYCSLSLFEIEENVKKHENDGWVLCSEKLPEPYEKVLIIDDFQDGIMVVGFMNDKKDFFVSWDLGEFGDVLAWQPLPRPY